MGGDLVHCSYTARTLLVHCSWAAIWYTAGDRGKDKDEDSFNGGSTSGRGLIRRGDSFRGAGQEGKVVRCTTYCRVGGPGESIGMLGRGRGETVQRWPTVGFFTSLRPIGAHATRQSSREQGIVLQSSREVGLDCTV